MYCCIIIYLVFAMVPHEIHKVYGVPFYVVKLLKIDLFRLMKDKNRKVLLIFNLRAYMPPRRSVDTVVAGCCLSHDGDEYFP